MKCKDACELIPGMLLGELDAEVQVDIESHLSTCEACRAEKKSMDLAVSSLRSAPPVAGSTERREAVVRAMGKEHADHVAWLLARPRRPWLQWVAAAALLALAAFFAMPESRESFDVAGVTGPVKVDRGARGLWVMLDPDGEVLGGDRVLVPQDGQVLLGGGGAVIQVYGEASFLIVGRRIALERGRLIVEHDGNGAPLEVSDPGNNVVRLQRGKVEIELRSVTTSVAGMKGMKGMKEGEEAPAATFRVTQRLHVRVVKGSAELEGSHAQRLRAEAGREGTFEFSGQPKLVPGREQE